MFGKRETENLARQYSLDRRPLRQICEHKMIENWKRPKWLVMRTNCSKTCTFSSTCTVEQLLVTFVNQNYLKCSHFRYLVPVIQLCSSLSNRRCRFWFLVFPHEERWRHRSCISGFMRTGVFTCSQTPPRISACQFVWHEICTSTITPASSNRCTYFLTGAVNVVSKCGRSVKECQKKLGYMQSAAKKKVNKYTMSTCWWSRVTDCMTLC